MHLRSFALVAALALLVPVAHATTPGDPQAGPPAAPVPKAAPTAPQAPQAGRDAYRDMVAALKRGDTVKPGELRAAYAASNAYDPLFGNPRDTDAILGAIGAGKFPEAARLVDMALDRSAVDIRAHMMGAMVKNRMGLRAAAASHRAFAMGLIRAVVGTRTGLSPEEAIVVIGVTEEYAVLDMLGLERVEQSLVRIGDRSYDRMETRDRRSGQRSTLYFDVTQPMAAYAKAIGLSLGEGATGGSEQAPSPRSGN